MTKKRLTLPKSPDKNIFNLLSRAKLMMSHALKHASSGSEIDRMVAIHGLDNSIEYVLRIISTHLDIEADSGKNFDSVELASLAGEINKYLKEKYNIQLPYLAEIKLIRQVRNLVQHAVVDPKPDLDRFSSVTERFFLHVLKKIFGLSSGELTISSIIKNETIKTHLEQAEKKLEKKEYLESIVASRDAFENGYYYRTISSHVTLSLMPAVVEAHAIKSQSLWSIKTVMEELELSRLGINSDDYRRFQDYLRHIPREFLVDSKAINTVMQRPWEKKDALFCYEFAANTVLIWQSQEKPPLYEIKYDPSQYSWKESINKIELSKPFEGGCVYVGDREDQFHLWYLPKKVKDKLEKLTLNKKYEIKSSRHNYGKLEYSSTEKIKLLGLYISLITNNPERWQVIAWYKEDKKSSKRVSK